MKKIEISREMARKIASVLGGIAVCAMLCFISGIPLEIVMVQNASEALTIALFVGLMGAAGSRQNGWEVVWFGMGAVVAALISGHPIALPWLCLIFGGIGGVFVQRFRPKPPTLSLVRQVRF